MITGRAPLIALIGGCVLFAAIVAMELASGSEEEVAQAGVTRRTDTAAPAERPRAPATDEFVAAVLARPLFSPTRRPPEQVPAAAAPIEDALAGARLTGIVIGPDRRMAIFAISGAKPLELSEGQSVTGWQIDRITPQGVRMSGATGVRTLIPTIDPLLDAPAKTAKTGSPSPPMPAPASQVGSGSSRIPEPRRAR